MFGGYRALEPRYRIEHQRVDLILMLLQEQLAIATLRWLHVVVQVAIAQISEVDQP